MTTAVDHLVVAAATLEQAVAWCEATLGVTPGPGGQHALMGTHNRLLRLGGDTCPNTDPDPGPDNYPDAYLELIALDAQAAPPARARWFGLDDPALQATLQNQGPRLLNVVARSTMLDMHRWGLMNIGLQPGNPVALQRDTPQGRLAWQILLRDDGQLLAGGALPTLIQWAGRHPAGAMPASGLALKSLTLRGAPPRAAEVLRLRGVQWLPSGQPALSALLLTPRGEVVLESA